MSITYREALAMIAKHIKPLHVSQKVPLLQALGYCTTEDIFAHFELPSTAISLREGYGIHLYKGNHYRLTDIIDVIPQGYACKLFTGDALPCGVDAVVADEEIDALSKESIDFSLHVEKGRHIKCKGEDIHIHECLLQRGERLNARKITSIASQGITHIKTLKKPKVSILSISKHLTKTTHNSNALSLGARILELGGEIGEIEECHDEAHIVPMLEKMTRNTDFIITCGAMSSCDMMQNTLHNDIFHILFQSVKIAPAKPSALSFLNQTPLLHLPGFPLSCMLGFEMLGVPIVKKLQNLALPTPITLRNSKPLTCKEDCVSAIPGYGEGGEFLATAHYEAGRLNALTQCNGYILIEDQHTIEKGASVPFFLF